MAAPRAQIEVKGINSLARALKDAEQAGMLDELKAAHAQSAGIVHQAAVRATPLLTGRLVRTVRGSATPRAGTVRAGNRGAIPYAGVIHFGWPRRNISPQPFLYDALDERRPMVEAVYRAAVDRVAAKVNASTPPGSD